MDSRCPSCDGELRVFFEMPRVPVFCNVTFPDRKSAHAAPTAAMRLGYCGQCGLIYNTAFDLALMGYSGEYENSLHFSPRFRQYADELSRSLVDRHHLRGKTIVEIGCGQADFLTALCRMGDNKGYGFDPSFDRTKTATNVHPNVSIVADYYPPSKSAASAPTGGLGPDGNFAGEGTGGTPAPDLICCRHVLEHIARPLEFLRRVRQAIAGRPGAIVFFEVPNALYTLRDMGIWDVIYEHCSYFTPASLAALFARAGFAVERVAELYDGQFLAIEARPCDAPPQPARESRGDVASLVEQFGEHFRQRVARWREKLDRLRAQGKRALAWGAGSKGVTFLNVLEASIQTVPCIVDLNPRKHGRFVARTGQEIISPESTRRFAPDLLIIMNPIYAGEIGSQAAQLGLRAEAVVA